MVGINHIALAVGDVDEAVEFYGRVFDLELRGRSGRMAFLDMGDQFIALAEGDDPVADRQRHFGLVVDDVPAVLAAAREQGASVRGNNVGDPWGNRFDVVAYSEVQFTKTAPVLRAQDAGDLEKGEAALAELRAKGIDLDGE